MTETAINVGHNGHQTTNQPNYMIQFNVDYFKTRDGALKLLQLVRNVSDVA